MKTLFYAVALPIFTCFFTGIFASTQSQQQREIPTHPALVTVPTEESLKLYPPKTELSKKAIHLRIGMTKKEVFELLGKPTWANSEKPLILIWRNGNCNPIEVIFDQNLKVAGYDEGRAECLEKIYFAVPDDKYLCTHVDKQNLCKVKSMKNLA
jgi:hypothetical protein